VDDIEDALSRYAGLEVPSVKLGELVMDRLRGLDRVAYVRFASVYRNFQDAGEFQEFVDEMTNFTGVKDPHDDQVDGFVAGFDAIESGAAVPVVSASTPMSRWHGTTGRGFG